MTAKGFTIKQSTPKNSKVRKRSFEMLGTTVKQHLIYPANITKTDGIYYVDFPDFQGSLFTNGDTLEEATVNAKEVLEDMVYFYHHKKLTLPKPFKVTPVKEKDMTIAISVWTPPIINKANSKPIRKNTTIPKWLADKADDVGVNYSELLQTALKNELNIPLDSGITTIK